MSGNTQQQSFWKQLLEALKKKLLEMITNAGVGATCFEKLEEIDEALNKLAENEVLSAEAIEKMCEIVTSVNEQMHCFTQENVKEFQEEFAKQLNSVNLIRDDIKQSQNLQEEVMKQFEKEGINITQEQYDKAELYHEKNTSSFYLVVEGTQKAVKIDCSFKKDEKDPSLSIPVYDVNLNPDIKSEALSAKFLKENSGEEARTFHDPQQEGTKRFEKIDLTEKNGQDKFTYTMTLLNASEKGMPVLTNEKDLAVVKAEAEKSVIDSITDPNLKYLLNMKNGAENGDCEVKYFEKDNTFAIRNKETGTLITGHVTNNGNKIEFASQEGIIKSLNDVESIVDLTQGSTKDKHKFCTISNDSENGGFGLKCVSNNSKISVEAVQMFHSSDINKFLQANGMSQEAVNALINDESKIYSKPARVDEKYMFRVEKMKDSISKAIAPNGKLTGNGLSVELVETRNHCPSLLIKSSKTQEHLVIDFNERGTANNFYYKFDKEKASPIYNVGKNQTTVSFENMKQGKMFNDLFMLAFDHCEERTAQKIAEENIRQVQQSKPREKEQPLVDTNSEKFINVHFSNPEYAKATAEILNEINTFMAKADSLQVKIQKTENVLKDITRQGKEARATIDDPKATAEKKENAKLHRKTLVNKHRSTSQKQSNLEAEYDSLVKSSPYGILHLQTYSKLSEQEQEQAKPYFDELKKVYSAFTDIDLSKASDENRDTLEKAKAEALIAYADFVKTYPAPEKYLAEIQNSPEINNEQFVSEPPYDIQPEYNNIPPDDYSYPEPDISPEELAYYGGNNEISAEEYEAMARANGYDVEEDSMELTVEQ